jgi:hypothetical protein
VKQASVSRCPVAQFSLKMDRSNGPPGAPVVVVVGAAVVVVVGAPVVVVVVGPAVVVVVATGVLAKVQPLSLSGRVTVNGPEPM